MRVEKPIRTRLFEINYSGVGKAGAGATGTGSAGAGASSGLPLEESTPSSTEERFSIVPSTVRPMLVKKNRFGMRKRDLNDHLKKPI